MDSLGRQKVYPMSQGGCSSGIKKVGDLFIAMPVGRGIQEGDIKLWNHLATVLKDVVLPDDEHSLYELLEENYKAIVGSRTDNNNPGWVVAYSSFVSPIWWRETAFPYLLRQANYLSAVKKTPYPSSKPKCALF